MSHFRYFSKTKNNAFENDLAFPLRHLFNPLHNINEKLVIGRMNEKKSELSYSSQKIFSRTKLSKKIRYLSIKKLMKKIFIELCTSKRFTVLRKVKKFKRIII